MNYFFRKYKPFPDAGTAERLHCCGGEGAKPPTAESVGSADGPAVLGSEGLRTCKSESQGVKGQNCPATVATTESCTIDLGTTPESLHGLTGVPPSGNAACGAWARWKGVPGTQAGEGSGILTSGSKSEGYGGEWPEVAYSAGVKLRPTGWLTWIKRRGFCESEGARDRARFV